MGVPHHLIVAKFQALEARLDKALARADALTVERNVEPVLIDETLVQDMLARMDAWDESAHPRGQPTNKGQFATKGEATGGTVAITSPPGSMSYDAHVGGQYAGSASLNARGHPFLSHVNVEEAHRGKGIGHALYDHAEKELGRKLVPSPLGLSETANEIWKRRLHDMPTAEAKKLLAESKEIGKSYGVSEEDIDKRHESLHAVVDGKMHPGHGYSREAFIDGQGRIHTPHVEDAARALYENKPVVLAQPREVSTLLDHLSKVSAEMIKLKLKAKDFDLCNVSVQGTNLFCSESKGIPRVKMPQFDLEDTERFKKFLAKKGYTVSEGQELASHLRATQNQLNGVKVAAIAQHFDPKQAVRTVISNDNYILDGHHRWAALIGLAAQKGNFDAMKMDVARINIGIIDLLREAEEFGAKHASFTDFKTASQTGEPTKVQRADAYDPSEPRDESGEWTAGGGAGKHPKAQARLAMWRRAG